MPSLKHLSSVAHSMGHHSQSTLSWLHPHLAHACRSAGLSEVGVDLLAEDPYPGELPASEPLRLALGGLRAKFFELLGKYELDSGDVQSAHLTFTFRPNDDLDCAVRSTICSRKGREFSHFIDFIIPLSGPAA